MVVITTPNITRSLAQKLGLRGKVIVNSQNSVFPIIDVRPRIPSLRVISLGDPAANTEYTTQTVPAGKIWRIIGFAAQLVTDATAANRQFRMDFLDANNNIFGGIGSITSHTASLTVNYRIVNFGAIGSTLMGGGHIVMSFPDTLFLPAGFSITFNTVNKAAGDNWGAGFMGVEEYDMAEEGYVRYS